MKRSADERPVPASVATMNRPSPPRLIPACSTALIGLVLCVATLGGCQPRVAPATPTASADPIPAAPSLSLIRPGDAMKLGYNLRWATDLGVPSDQRLQHVRWLDDMVVCVESPSNLISTLSVHDGGLMWERVIGQPSETLFGPLRQGPQLLVNTQTALYRLDARTGRPLQTHLLDTTVTTDPVWVDHHVLLGNLDHQLMAFDLDAGFVKWAYQLTDRLYTPPVAWGDSIFVADGRGVYAMLSAITGDLQWKGRTFARVSASPSVLSQGLFIASEDHSLYSLNRATGRDRWVYRTTQPLARPPKVLGNTVYQPVPGRGTVAIDSRTGSVVWELPYHALPLFQTGNRLLVFNATDATALAFVDAQTGQTLLQVPVQRLMTVLPGPNGRLILVTKTGRMARLDPIDS